MTTEGNDTSTGKLEDQKIYDETVGVKIPKMKIVRELYADTRSSPVYLVSYKPGEKKGEEAKSSKRRIDKRVK